MVFTACLSLWYCCGLLEQLRIPHQLRLPRAKPCKALLGQDVGKCQLQNSVNTLSCLIMDGKELTLGNSYVEKENVGM